MTIQAQLADGRVLEFPDGTDPQVIQATVKRVLTSSASAPQEGLGAATVGGFKRAAAGLETALGSIIDPELAAQRGLARQQEIASQYAPGANLEKVKEAYAKEGLLSAAGEAISQVPAALAEQFPNIAATLAAGKAGAVAGSAFGPVGTVVGGLGGAAIPSVLQLYGSNLIRQAEERPEDISRTAALTAAVPGAALEVAATAIPLGRTFIGKILGPEAEKLLARGTSASLERAAKEGVAATLLRGGAVGAGAEIPTEVAQQMLERLQAGLPLTTPDALAEYGEAAYGATLVGTPFGAAGRAAGRAGAREQYAALKQKEDEAAFRAEQQRALAAQEEEFKQTRERLGIPEEPLLALPAPAEVAEPEKPVDLQNPIGNITREELAPEVLKYVDKYRKDMGMPRLQSFSVEDIRDAMTNINPEGEQAALDSILAFKTGFKGEETFSPEDVINAAVAKNIAPETKGFADFLERATGKRELETMTQPQLYAAFKSLTDLPDVVPGEQRVLPEGSNANRFTQKQYDRAIKYVNTGFAEVGGQPLAREVVSQELMEAAGLESQRAADMLLNAALRNGDLSESRQQVFRTIDPKTGEIKFTYFDREKAEAAAKKQKLNVQEQTLVSIAPKEAPKPSPRAPLPGGFEIAEQAFVEGERPSGYAITPEGRMKPLATVLEEQDVEGKIERLQGLRRKEADKMLQDVSKHEQTVARGRAALESMEARGEVDTDGYKKAKAQLARAEDILGRRIETLLNRIEEYTAPLQAKPFGKKQTTRKGFTVTKGGKTVGTFPTRAEAEQSILAQLSDKELQDIVDAAKQGPLSNRAQVELESRQKPGIRVKRTPKSEEQVKAEKERDERVQKLEELLVPMLAKFGLKDVALKIVDRIENGAGGSYFDKLIKISLEEDKPIQTLRHEAIHALKELGFFTPQQWKALEQQARKTWIDKYLKGQMTELDGKVMTRFDAYKKLGLSEADILEEAIADAFGDFDATKPPAGMMAVLFKRIKEFFAAIKRALTGAGFESAEEIFGKIEAGKLEKRAEAVDAAAEKFSLAPKGIPQDIWSQHERTRLLDQQDLDAAAPQKKAGVTRSWRTLNKMVNAHTKDEQAALKMMADMNQISSIRQAIAEGDDRALANYKVMAPELYAQETGEKFSLAKSSEANAWQADEATIKAADKFEEENGIRPYVSEGFLDLPIEAPKYSLQKFNPEKHLKFDPTLGVPINKDGTVTVYYHTTKQGSLNIGQSKVIPSEGRNRIYVTNESGGADVLRNRGNFDQDLDGSTVLVYVTPDMLQLDAEYENGRRDFFIPLAQGDFFNKKMKMQSIQKGRQEAITEEFSYEDHANRIDKAVKAYKDASAADRKKMVAAARKLLKKEHNVGSLLSENGKLEKTRIGEYGLDYQGNSVASQGLGLASAQKITDKVSTCPRSAICEGLCLGETSGGNFMFGGIASEDVEDIAKSAFRAGPRMMQYLKTEALIINPEAFATVLQAEIDSLKKWSASPTQTKINKETKKREQVEKEIYQPAVRLNVTSDFKPDMFRAIIEGNPDVMFYDYTKLGSESIAPNHHLTYSSTGFGQIVDGEKVFFKNKAGQYDHNWATMRSRLNNGQNVAMAFSSKSELPKFLVDEETGVQYRVWDGDDYDARFLDPKQPDGKGMIIGLRNKAGNLSEKNATKKTGGFFVQYDPKKDGDTVVVPNQVQFKGTGRKVVEIKPTEKYSLRQVKQIFNEAEEIPMPPGVESIREQWIGGVSGIGDRDAMYDLYRVDGSKQYIKAVQNFVRKKLGDDFKGYRLMSNDELEELETGAMGSQFASFTLNPDVARAFKNIPAYANKTGMSVIEMDLTPEHVMMFGHPGELELVVDYGQGYNPSNIKIVEKYSLRTSFPTAKEAEAAAYAKAPPETKEFKLFQGASKLVEEGRAVPMFHASPNIFTQFRENKPIFVSPSAQEAEYFGKRHRTPDNMDVNVYPLWVRAETPFDYENPDHVRQVMDKMAQDGTLQGKTEAFFNRGHWEYIEDGQVQSAIKALGFDSFYVKEGKTKNLGIYNANQVKSITGNIGEFGPNKDIRFSLKSAVSAFDPKAIERDSQTEYKGRDKLIDMKISDFLALADDEYDPIKQQRADRLVKEGVKLSNIPFLKAYGDGDTLVVDAHEGRHRARALQKAGYETMPVVLATDIRYSEQLDPKKFDYRETWPSKIKAQSKAKDPSFTIPFPFTREEGAENYQPKYSLPRIDPRITERVDDITPVREEQGFFQRITEAISPRSYGSLRQSYLNRYERLGQYDKMLAQRMGGEALLADQSAESAALMSDLASGVAASAMGYGDRQGGIPVYRGGTTIIDREVKGLIASLAPLAKYGDPKVYQYYQFWAGAKRARRLRAEDRERLFTPDDFAYADILARQFPEFEDVQKDLIAFNNGIVKYMVDTQVLSPEQGAKYTEHADYIPFYRQMEGEQTAGPNIFSAISGVRPPKKLKGGTAPLADFLETLVRNTQSSIEAGMKNAAALRAINVVQRIGDAPGVSLERLDTQETGPNIINVLERGKRVSYRTPDRLLVEAVGSLNMSELPFMGLIAGPSNFLRNMVTKDPGFMLANLLRDSLSSYVTSGQNMVPIAGTMTSFARALARRSPGYEALLDAGVIGGYELSQNVEKTGDDLARDLDRKAGKKDPILLRPFTSLWQALETGTTASDAATRALVYERVLKETGNEAEALFRALEVMNFNRKGNSPLIRVLTAAVPFFNARLQGLDLFYRASTGNMNMKDAKAIQRKFFVRGATMMALSVMYYMMVADDEEYKKQEQETKDNNWLITPLGIRIPTPFEVGFIFKTMPERITAYALGNDTGQDLIDATKRGLINTFGFNPIPQTVKPAVEAVTNFNFFTMRPIVGQGMGDVAPEFQVGPGTSKIAEKLGGALGVSPIKLDHVLKGYSGTIGTYVVDATDLIMEQFGEGTKANKRFEQLPVVKRFVIDPEARGTITAYYQLKDAVDTFTRTSNLLEKTSKPEEFVKYVKENAGVFAVKDYVLDLEKEMKELREMRRMVLSSPMDGEQKKNLLITIGRAEQNLTSNIQTVKKIISSAQ